MPTAQNLDALTGKGEFHARKPGAEPLTTKGHAPGVKVGNDAKPEFSAETYPPGTAPPEVSYKPNPISEVPGQADNPDMDPSSRTEALDMPGATSATVYNDNKWGKPIQGQTSNELHGIRKKERSGLEGTGASTGYDKVRAVGADLEGKAAEMKGQRGKSGKTEGGMNWPGAEENPPVAPEELSAERRRPGRPV